MGARLVRGGGFSRIPPESRRENVALQNQKIHKIEKVWTVTVRVCIVTRVWATDNDTVTVPKLIFIYDTVTNTDHVRSSPRVSRGDEHDPFD